MTWAPDYADTELLKDYLDIQHSDVDAFLGIWVTATSRNVDDFCHRQFGQVAAPETRTYIPKWDRRLNKTSIEIDDLQDITGFELYDESGTEITEYTFQPLNNVAKGKPYTEVLVPQCLTGNVTALGLWGWNDIPSSVTEGLLLQAARLSARRNSPFGVAGSPQNGSELRLLAKVDADFQVTLTPFIRRWWAR